MNKKAIALGVSIPLLVGAWALFRPELLFIDKKVEEKAVAQAQTSAAGEFESYAHPTTGRAVLQRSGDGWTVRLEGLKTDNGPDLRVLLVSGSDPQRYDTNIDLGALKGNEGNQNYVVPGKVDPSKPYSVTIWCRRFDVAFGGATLGQAL
jgi:hypothetical protein